MAKLTLKSLMKSYVSIATHMTNLLYIPSCDILDVVATDIIGVLDTGIIILGSL